MVFKPGKSYKHENMVDVHFHVLSVHQENGGYRMIVQWHNEHHRMPIGSDNLFINHNDTDKYREILHEDLWGGFGDDIV